MYAGLFISIAVIILVVGLLIWVLLIYPKSYKRNINKALNDELPVRSIEPTTLFGGLSFLIIIVLNIILLVSLSSAKDDINNLQTMINNLNNQITSIQYQIANVNNNVNEMLEDSKWVKSTEYEILDLNSNGSADVEILIEMNRIPINGSITLIYVDENNQIQEVPLTSTNTIFSTTITIDIENYYDFSLMVNDGTTIENEDLFSFSVYTLLRYYNYINLELLLENDDTLTKVFEIHNQYADYPELKFTEVQIEITIDGIVVLSDTVTVPISDDGSEQVFEISIDTSTYEGDEMMISIFGVDQLGLEYEVYRDGWILDNDSSVIS